MARRPNESFADYRTRRAAANKALKDRKPVMLIEAEKGYRGERGQYGIGLRKAITQKNLARRANGQRMVA